jgi:hypothetical protein
MIGRSGRTVIVGALCLALLGAPVPAAARVTVTFQFAYGAVVVGGVGVFIAVGGTWDLGLARRDASAALLELGEGGLRAAVPVPALCLAPDPAEPERAVPGVRVDLLRWRF